MYILNKSMRDDFLKGLAKKNSYVLNFSSLQIKKKEDIAFGAKKLYLSGTPFNNRGGEGKRQPRMTNEESIGRVLESLVDELWEYFNDTSVVMGCQSDLDTFHEKLCDSFMRCFKIEGFDHTYGNAQKFINILFKYLSCYQDAPDFAEKFQYCHMAIDRYTYNGYRLPFYKNIVYKSKANKYNGPLKAWSNLEKSSDPGYKEISSDIIKYITENPKTFNDYLEIGHRIGLFDTISRLEEDYVLTPFEAEFFIWAICKAAAKKINKKYIHSQDKINELKELL